MGEQPLPPVPAAKFMPLQATLFAKSPLLNGFLLPCSDDSSILLYLFTL